MDMGLTINTSFDDHLIMTYNKRSDEAVEKFG